MQIKFSILLFLLAGKNFGQPIELWNASFEADEHQCCVTPTDWYNCGSVQATPPDIQPGHWGVDLPAPDGNTYLGLVVRDNETAEAIGQKLRNSLQKDNTYMLTFSIARSLQWRSTATTSRESISFTTPATLKIWGGVSPCEKKRNPLTNN